MPDDLVERVARAIHANAWLWYDRSLVPFIENRGARSSTDDCATYEMMWKYGCRTVDDAKDWWLTTDRPVMVRVYHFRESLRLAKAAIEASGLTQLTAERDALAAQCEALAGALERCGKIVEVNLYRQHEKIEDVKLIARTALAAYKGDAG